MMLRSKLAGTAFAVAGLAALAACGTTTPAVTPAAQTGVPATASPVPTVEATPEVIEASPSSPASPVPRPTVAKTQRRVEIYSGPSDVPLPSPAANGKAGNVVQLNSTASDEIGTYVADGRGMTLYRFDKDTAKPSKSACTGDCAKTWPPLLIKSPGKIYPSGVDPRLVGYVERPDGTCQVTVNGWPVYYFAKDTKPGDLLGQGVGGAWFAIGPSGGKTRAAVEVVPVPGSAGY
ncbi:hypothetical protein AB0J86_27555 [Micromonospora sp. NPDC049559]|uniref:COG4315 family predicted lipoprotein n=1 Tax=Micromonospora sp. NPDC049559 TaxID=3155923 RepID=UPI00341C648A